MQLSRAAFAVILKFTENIDTFEALKTNIEVIAQTVTSEGPQKVKEIIQKLKTAKDADYEAMLKRWETANMMRKWTQQLRLSISEKANAEEEEKFRQEYNKAHPSAEPLTGQLSDE